MKSNRSMLEQMMWEMNICKEADIKIEKQAQIAVKAFSEILSTQAVLVSNMITCADVNPAMILLLSDELKLLTKEWKIQESFLKSKQEKIRMSLIGLSLLESTLAEVAPEEMENPIWFQNFTNSTKRFLVLRTYNRTEPVKACETFEEAADLIRKIERQSCASGDIIDLMDWCTEEGRDVTKEIWEKLLGLDSKEGENK